MGMRKVTAVGTIILAIVAVLSYLNRYGSASSHDTSLAVESNHAETTASGPGVTSSGMSNVTNIYSSNISDNRVSVGGNGVAIGAGANVNIITNTKPAN